MKIVNGKTYSDCGMEITYDILVNQENGMLVTEQDEIFFACAFEDMPFED